MSGSRWTDAGFPSVQTGAMVRFKRGDLFDQAFLAGIVLKGLDGVLGSSQELT
jgi:hypothetical protein